MEVWPGGSNVRAVREGDEGLGGRECRYLNHAQKSRGYQGYHCVVNDWIQIRSSEKIKSVRESDA